MSNPYVPVEFPKWVKFGKMEAPVLVQDKAAEDAIHKEADPEGFAKAEAAAKAAAAAAKK